MQSAVWLEHRHQQVSHLTQCISMADGILGLMVVYSRYSAGGSVWCSTTMMVGRTWNLELWACFERGELLIWLL